MSKKDREGPSKRQEFREKRRQAELRNRWIVIGAIVIIAVLIVGAFAYYELQAGGRGPNRRREDAPECKSQFHGRSQCAG